MVRAYTESMWIRCSHFWRLLFSVISEEFCSLQNVENEKNYFMSCRKAQMQSALGQISQIFHLTNDISLYLVWLFSAPNLLHLSKAEPATQRTNHDNDKASQRKWQWQVNETDQPQNYQTKIQNSKWEYMTSVYSCNDIVHDSLARKQLIFFGWHYRIINYWLKIIMEHPNPLVKSAY